MRLGIIRLYCGQSGKKGYYNLQELGLAKALAKHNIEIFIFFLVDKKKYKDIQEEYIDKNITIVYYPALKLYNHGIVKTEIISKYGLEIVHLLSDNQLGATPIIKYCIKKNIPIYTYIGTVLSDSNNKLKKFVMKLFNQYTIHYYKKIHNVAKTHDVYEYLQSRGINNIEIIPVGLDMDDVHQMKKSQIELKCELGLPLYKDILLFVGRLEEYKNPLYGIQLINKLVKQYSNFHLVIIGDGSMRHIMEAKIGTLKLAECITFISKVPNAEMYKYYVASNVFLNFNNKEIFGMSILEAMYNKCPVIAINAPGPKDIISNNKDGILLPDFNLDNWISAIKSINENHSMGEEAHRNICEDYNWDKIAIKYIKLYEDLIGVRYE